MRLRLALADALEAAGVPACLILPSSCMSASAGAPAASFLEALTGFLNLGMVPLLGGDILADPARGFSVVSGDILAVRLALHFNAGRLYFASRVDGVYEHDPAQDPGARRVRRYRLQGDSVDLDAHSGVDASGAMDGKIKALAAAREAIRGGMEARIFSMQQQGRLLLLLDGAPGIGTEILA
jgi:isopentenyl phosphate kinase